MFNLMEMLKRGNRKQRRFAAKSEGLPIKFYPARMTPINLGIKEYKRIHSSRKTKNGKMSVDEPKRVEYYKKEMWSAFRELKESNESK